MNLGARIQAAHEIVTDDMLQLFIIKAYHGMDDSLPITYKVVASCKADAFMLAAAQSRGATPQLSKLELVEQS